TNRRVAIGPKLLLSTIASLKSARSIGCFPYGTKSLVARLPTFWTWLTKFWHYGCDSSWAGSRFLVTIVFGFRPLRAPAQRGHEVWAGGSGKDRVKPSGVQAALNGQALSDLPAWKRYGGNPAVRNFREGHGNVGIIRSPLRAIALPDQSTRRAHFCAHDSVE